MVLVTFAIILKRVHYERVKRRARLPEQQDFTNFIIVSRAFTGVRLRSLECIRVSLFRSAAFGQIYCWSLPHLFHPARALSHYGLCARHEQQSADDR